MFSGKEIEMHPLRERFASLDCKWWLAPTFPICQLGALQADKLICVLDSSCPVLQPALSALGMHWKPP